MFSPHPGSQQKHSSEQRVDEILMTGLGPDRTHPYLLSLIDEELVIYKAFHFEQTKNPGHLSIRFSKVFTFHSTKRYHTSDGFHKVVDNYSLV